MNAKRNACRTKKDLARSRRAFSRRAAFEPLEARHMMSAGNLFAEFVGTLTPAAPVERLDVQIAPEALGLLRDKALLGFELKGRDGQPFDPAAVQILRSDGSIVKPEFAADNVPGRTDSVVVAELAEGNYTIKVGGSLSARSQFFLDVFLVGDANGDHRVGRDDLDFIRQNYGASAGDARYNLAADANLDGRITAIDLSLARRNESDSRLPAPGVAMACMAEGATSDPAGATAPAPLLATAADPSAAVAGIVPTRGYDPDSPMRFYESTYGLVQAMGQDAQFHVPGDFGDTTALVFSWDYREAGYNNSLGYYYTDDMNTLHTVFASGEVPNGTTTSVLKAVEVDCDRDISFFIVQNGNAATWYATDTLNADNYAHFLLTQPGDPNYKSDWLQYKVEDLSPTIANPSGYQNDADYNDVVFSVAAVNGDLGIVLPDATEMGENDETAVGGFVVFNKDDDDASGTPDYQDGAHEEVDPDLVPLRLHAAASSGVAGVYTLSFSGQRLALWTNANRTGAIVSDSTAFDARLDTIVYVEGIAAPTGVLSEAIALKWGLSGGSAQRVDEVKYTVFDVDLDVNNNLSIGDDVDGTAKFLPGEVDGEFVICSDTGEYLGQQLHWVVAGVGGGIGIDEVVFTIIDTTNREGWTGGASDANVEGSNQDEDYSFLEIGNQRTASGTMGTDDTHAEFWCKDTGGTGIVEVALMQGGKPIAKTQVKAADDVDNDGLPDSWEISTYKDWCDYYKQPGWDIKRLQLQFLDANSDKEPADPDGLLNVDGGVNMPAHKSEGDGLKALDEYGGFLVHAGGFESNGQSPLPTSKEANGVRLLPYMKEVLVETDVMADTPAVPAKADLKAILNASSKAFADKDDGSGAIMWFLFDQGLTAAPASPHFVPANPQDLLNYTGEVSTPPGPNRNRAMRKCVHLMFADTANPAFLSTGTRGTSGTFGTLIFASNVKADVESDAGKLAQVNFADTMRSTVVHELTHLLLGEENNAPFDAQEHEADGDGNGTPLQQTDAQFIMYNYAQYLYDNSKVVKFSDATRRKLNFTSKESVERRP